MSGKFLKAALVVVCAAIAIPALTSEKVDDGKAMERIKAEVKAMSERGEQTKCPISGAPVKEGAGYVYMGHFIATCCDNCPKAVEKDPLTALMKVRANGEEPALAEGYTRQDKCPMSGKPASMEFSKVKDNALLAFCCPNCPAGYEKDPEGVLGKVEEKKMAPVILTLKQTACPVSGHDVNESTFVVAEGKKILLCCDGCKASVEAEPAKYLQAMADEGVVPEKAG